MLKVSEGDLKKYSSKQSVLIVDDEDLIVTMLERKLKRYFKSVDNARNGKEALEKYKENDFDLIISDIKMPVMNGIMFLKEIRKRDLNKRVIFMSAYDENEYFIELLNNGADGFLLKPHSEAGLLYLLYKNCKIIYEEKLNEALHKELDEKNTKLTKINLKFKKLYHKLIEKIKSDIKELVETKELAQEDLEIIDAKELVVENNKKNKCSENFISLKDKSSNKSFGKVSAKEYLTKIDFFKYNTDIVEEFEVMDELEYEIDSLFNRSNLIIDELITKIKYLLNKYLEILKMLVEFDTLKKVLNLLNDMLSFMDFKEIKEDKSKFLLHIESIVENLIDWRKAIFINQDTMDIHYLDDELINDCIEIQNLLQKE